MYTVYCHEFPNGKRYVAITGMSVDRRWNNGNGYKTCPLMDRAIKKYGWENVRHDILEVVENLSEAEGLEKHYISLFKSNDLKHGYNILPGGDVSNGNISEETRKKLGSGWRGKERSCEDKAKISRGVKRTFSREESNGHFGMHHTQETKDRMSESQKASWENNKKRRQSASERMAIRMEDPSFRNRVLTNLKSVPKRKPGEWSMPESAREKLREHFTGMWVGEKSPCSKPVLQFSKDGSFIKRWANAGDVERAGIAKRRNVGKCCSNAPHYKTAGGYVWKYEER